MAPEGLSTGRSTRQRSLACGHRGLKAQPAGGCRGFGTSPWTGVRECFAFTSICPQTQSDIRGEYGQLIMWDRQVGGMGEDCLSLNVWTTNVDRAAKKAVMVSFHGGGFSSSEAGQLISDAGYLIMPEHERMVLGREQRGARLGFADDGHGTVPSGKGGGCWSRGG